MKKKENLTLRTVGEKYMLVDTADNVMNLTAVYIMNRTAAWLWEKLGDGDISIEALAREMCMEYEVDYELVLNDILAQIDQWVTMGLLEK